MSIALIIAEHRDAIDLLPWAIDLALARKSNLLLVYLSRHASQKQRMELGPDQNADWGEYRQAIELLENAKGQLAPSDENDAADQSSSAGFEFRLINLQHPQPAAAICEELLRSSIKTLMIRRESTHSQTLDKESIKELASEVSCELVQIRTGKQQERPQSFVVPIGPGAQSETALRLAADFCAQNNAKLTALYVEPDVDEYAEQVGNQILDRRLDRIVVEGVQADRRVVLDDKVHRGIRSVFEDYDAIVLGIRHHGRMHRWLIRGLSEELLSQEDGPTTIAIRGATPLTGRIARAMDRLLREGVPQLDRHQRIAIVERIQSSSKWDFDFIALICLSTLIAAGGLIQNSAAVVIGAMLVAPLMTPLLGAGLSLVQGNLVLLRNALQTVSRGFIVAVALSYFVGWIWPDLSATSEMLQRGAPNVLDLLVAFISGIAAAYAIGRPNLLSALPGVAIAAALVPPTATVGLGLAMGQWQLALGASLLFLTNIVAIVLGTACSFLAVGVRGSHSFSAFQSRTLRIAVGLVAVLLGLAIYESLPQPHIPESIEAQIVELLETDGIRLVSLQWIDNDHAPTILVSVESRTPIPASIPEQLAEMVRQRITEPVRIRFETRLVTELNL